MCDGVIGRAGAHRDPVGSMKEAAQVSFTVSKDLADRVELLAARGDLTAQKGAGAMLEAYVAMTEWGHSAYEDIERRKAAGEKHEP